MTSRALEANVARYPWYLFFRDCYFWGPAFFLYFSSMLTLPQVLWLEAVYYVGVALLEVPSGYLSDALGRRKALVASSLCLATAYLLFFTGTGFIWFALAQLMLAAGFAFSSGTDTALHFESLAGLNRGEEYTRREGRALRFSFMAGALAALVGGWLAVHHLRWVYGASFISTLAGLGVALSMTEPETGTGRDAPPAFAAQIRQQFKKAWHRQFRFFALYTIFMTVVIHFSYEFYQPFLERVVQSLGQNPNITPGLAGVHLAVTMLVSAGFTRVPGMISHYCRIRPTLLGCFLFQATLAGVMALFVHPAVAGILVFRTVSRAISVPLINGELSPLLERRERATFLSLLSLLGRVSYGVVLVVLPLAAGLFKDHFQGALLTATIVGGLLFAVLLATPFPQKNGHACCSKSAHPSSAHQDR